MGVVHHLTTICAISSVTTSYWVKNLLFVFWCIKSWMNLNGTEQLVEMDCNNYGKDRESFGNVLKICQKSTCGRAALLET